MLAGIINSLEPLAGFDWPEGPFCGLQRGWHRNGGGTGSQSETTEASGPGEGSPRKAGCALRPSPRDPGVLGLQQQVPPGCCSHGRYPSSLPDPSSIQSPEALPQVGTSSTSASQGPFLGTHEPSDLGWVELGRAIVDFGSGVGFSEQIYETGSVAKRQLNLPQGRGPRGTLVPEGHPDPELTKPRPMHLPIKADPWRPTVYPSPARPSG